MNKATELFKTLESLKPHQGEMWEDDDGEKYQLVFVGKYAVFARADDAEYSFSLTLWLARNTLPLSIRNAPKPEMVTKEFWEVVAWRGSGVLRHERGNSWIYESEEAARADAAILDWPNTAIRKLSPAEYEVIRKGGV